MIRTLRIVSAIALCAALASCGSSRPSKFYSLQVPSATPAAASRLPVDVLVGRISAPQILRDDRIAYRASATELGTYEYHRWAEPPAVMIEELVLRSLRDSGRFRSVQTQKSNTRGEFIVRGRLYEFGEVSGTPLTGRIKLELEAYDPGEGRVVFTRLFASDEPVNGKEVADVVVALDRGVQRAVSEFVPAFADYCAKNPPRK